MIQRRGFLAGIGALLAAPAIIRTPGLLMPVRPLIVPTNTTVRIAEIINASMRLHMANIAWKENALFPALAATESPMRIRLPNDYTKLDTTGPFVP